MSEDTISRQEVIDTVRKIILGFFSEKDGVMTDTEKTLLSVNKAICNGVRALPPAQPETHEERTETHGVCLDTISRQDAIRIVDGIDTWQAGWRGDAIESMKALPSAQLEVVRCKDCEYGEQDEVGRWFCRSLGCQIGNEDGSGYCADAERRTDEALR